jgi:hypothetical protein
MKSEAVKRAIEEFFKNNKVSLSVESDDDESKEMELGMMDSEDPMKDKPVPKGKK